MLLSYVKVTAEIKKRSDGPDAIVWAEGEGAWAFKFVINRHGAEDGKKWQRYEDVYCPFVISGSITEFCNYS